MESRGPTWKSSQSILITRVAEKQGINRWAQVWKVGMERPEYATLFQSHPLTCLGPGLRLGNMEVVLEIPFQLQNAIIL